MTTIKNLKVFSGIAIILYMSESIAKAQYLIYDFEKAELINRQYTTIFTLIIIGVVIYWSVTKHKKSNIH